MIFLVTNNLVGTVLLEFQENELALVFDCRGKLTFENPLRICTWASFA